MPTATTNIFTHINNTGSQAETTAERLRGFLASTQTHMEVFPPGLGQVDSIKSTLPFTVFAPYVQSRLRSIRPNRVLDEIPPPNFAIVLPVPASAMKTAYGVSYGQVDLGTIAGGIASQLRDPSWSNIATGAGIGGALGALVSAASSASIPAKAAATALATATGGLLSAEVLAGTALEGVGAIGSHIARADVESALNRAFGYQQNPYSDVLFQNVQFRTHQFDYMFLPRSEAESVTIDRIISMFKFYMHPALGAGPLGTSSGNQAGAPDELGLYFYFPYEFQITHSIQDTTFTLMPSVLESIDVSYGGTGDTPTFFMPDSRGRQWPTQVNLSMKFKEVIILTREQIDTDVSIVQDDAVNVRKTTGVDPTKSRYRF